MRSKVQLAGFSLIELLISVTIITMTIALTNIVYSNYVQNDFRFNKRSEMYADLLEVTDEIRLQVKNSLEQNGKVNVNNTQCQWEIIKSLEKQGINFDLETGRRTTGGNSYFLHSVEIHCSNQDRSLKPFEIDVLVIGNEDIGDWG